MAADPAETIATNAVVPALNGPSQIGGWLVQRRVGAGAMGEVFLAQRGPQRAALKLVAKRYAGDDSFIQRFQREIALLSKFDHPNVARALDGGEHEGRPWLAMEFVNGPDLEGLLNGHGPFFESDVLSLAIQVGRGLEHIHQRAGLIHRDVKPANILVARAPGGDPNRLLNPGDMAKLIDFGLAKPVEQDEGSGLTMTGMIMGTPNYIAPEQVACERHLTLHVDMYALGASMFHLLTGSVPFQRTSAAAVMAAHLNDVVPDPGQLVPAISSQTRAVVMTAMAKRAGERFVDWNAFVVACEKALRALGAPGEVASSRFLKRPLAKPQTGPQRNTGSGQHSGTRSPAKPVPAVGNVAALEPRDAGAAVISAALNPAPRTGADALRAAVTSRIQKPGSTSGMVKATTRRQNRNVETSAVSSWSGRLEKSGTTGGSILPWLILGLAGALAVAGAIWALSI